MPANEMKSTSLEKVRAATSVVATILIRVVVLVVGNWYTSSSLERASAVRLIEVAISILSAPPTGETNEIRQWAIDVINRYSEVALSVGAKAELEQHELSAECYAVEQSVSLEDGSVHTEDIISCRTPYGWVKVDPASSGQPQESVGGRME